MSTIMYMAQSVNGSIAHSDDSTDWISDNEWSHYVAAIQKTGNLIVGRKTYEILKEYPGFSVIASANIIVLSKSTINLSHPHHKVASTPYEALQLVAPDQDVIIAGGSQTNAAFLTEHLVDELYIDIEPILIGDGLPLFTTIPHDLSLTLLNCKTIGSHEVQLHYRIDNQ